MLQPMGAQRFLGLIQFRDNLGGGVAAQPHDCREGVEHTKRKAVAMQAESQLFWQFAELEQPAPSFTQTRSGLPKWPLSYIPPCHLRLPDFDYQDACDGAPFVPLTRDEAMTVHLSARKRDLPTASGSGEFRRSPAARPPRRGTPATPRPG